MKIAILPGDGIGPEIVDQAQRVLEVLREGGLPIVTRIRRRSAARATTSAGHPLPPATLDARAGGRRDPAGRGRAVRSYDTLPRELRPEQGILGIRKALGLFANLRPALLYPELAAASTLKPEVVAGLDLMIVRELTGDIYFGQPRGRRKNAHGRGRGLRHDALRVPEIERIARVGFETARKRGKRCARSTRRTCSTPASCGARS